MFGCATPEQIASLFLDEANGIATQRLRTHVVNCPHCRPILDHLADAPDLKEKLTPREALGAPGLPQGLLDQLREMPDQVTDESERAAVPVDLDFLGPPAVPGEPGTLGPYRVLSLLGSGSMGVVLLGFDPEQERVVAIKTLPPSRSSPESRARFEREARAMARVNHRNVVAVLAVQRLPDGTPLLVMQAHCGTTLRQRLQNGPPPTFAESAGWCQQLAEGLAAAHRLGLVHRDVKPENVLLGFDSVPRLGDFGLARRIASGDGDSVTLPGQIVGTPAYMSPEQSQGKPARLHPCTDIYSLGALLYELLTGTVPFPGGDQAVLRRIVHETPRAPRQVDGRIPKELEAICLKAMAKSTDQRYPTAQALADDLGRYLAGSSVRAISDVAPSGRWSWAWRIWRSERRERS